MPDPSRLSEPSAVMSARSLSPGHRHGEISADRVITKRYDQIRIGCRIVGGWTVLVPLEIIITDTVGVHRVNADHNCHL
ncbi:hypothetical protein NL676_002174 [Syzygium grande]|nr:hypothetical protein NL676_002174 [Syzygium grande]